MWWMTLQSPLEVMDYPYPERPQEPDCAYYMKTGHCAFGMDCRYNHPPDRSSASAMDRSKEQYPERIGQAECQYYMKTGTCKYGSSCKYHHPRDKALAGTLRQLNALNLPLRPGEKDCAFYMRTGTCKYGTTCKFNHPHPSSSVSGGPLSMSNSLNFPGTGVGSAFPAAQLYHPGFNQLWPIPPSRLPLMPSPRSSGQPSFSPMVLPGAPQNLMHLPSPGWNTYQFDMNVQSPGLFNLPLDATQHQAAMQQASYLYATTPPMQDPRPPPFSGGLSFSPYMHGPPGAMAFPMQPSPPAALSRDVMIYPERPGQPECQYYMKNGDCKFGSTCKYHHPKERIAGSGIVFGPTGLPLRPGAPPCTFYGRHGFCKYGSTCKFDHPFSSLPYNSQPVFSIAETPVPAPSLSTLVSRTTSRLEPPAGGDRQQIPSRPRGEESSNP